MTDFDDTPWPHPTRGHGLPISNGFGSRCEEGETPVVTVWCGRCKGLFLADADFARRYLEALEGRLSWDLEQPGPYGINQAQYDQRINEVRGRLGHLLEPSSDRS